MEMEKLGRICIAETSQDMCQGNRSCGPGCEICFCYKTVTGVQTSFPSESPGSVVCVGICVYGVSVMCGGDVCGMYTLGIYMYICVVCCECMCAL